MRDFAIGSGWVLVIVAPLCVLALWFAIDHSNANQQRALNHSNSQFRAAQILATRRFQEAVLLSTKQTNYANNRRVCGWRTFINPILKSYKDAAKDPTLSASARARNDKRIKTTQQFLDNQITIPPVFDCKTLPKKPPTSLP